MFSEWLSDVRKRAWIFTDFCNANPPNVAGFKASIKREVMELRQEKRSTPRAFRSRLTHNPFTKVVLKLRSPGDLQKQKIRGHICHLNPKLEAEPSSLCSNTPSGGSEAHCLETTPYTTTRTSGPVSSEHAYQEPQPSEVRCKKWNEKMSTLL